MQAFWQRRAWFIAWADRVSHSSELVDNDSVDSLQEAAAAAGQHPCRGWGGEVVQSHANIHRRCSRSLTPSRAWGCSSATSCGWLCRTGHCLPSLLPPCAGQDPSLMLVRWGLQLFLVPACAICLFPEHPCRICVLAG